MIGDGEFRVPAVRRVSGEARAVAQVLASSATERADAAGESEPWDANAVPERETSTPRSNPLDRANDLMAGDQREDGVWQLAIDHVQVSAAHAACPDADQNLALLGLGDRHVGRAERSARLVQDHR